MKNYLIIFFCLLVFLSICETSVLAAEPVLQGIGVMSDSSSDEYRADDNRGGTYSATTLNWVELLVRYRGLNFGPWGSWGGPRRSGYEYNWSLSGAETDTALTNGQHTGLAQQVNSGKVTLAYYNLGINDFAWYRSTFGQIYNGTLSGTALDSYLNAVFNNIRTAVDTINSSGKARVLIALVPDPGVSPSAVQQYPDATKRARVTAAVAKVNQSVKSYAQSRNFAVFDTDDIAQSVLSRIDAQGNVDVGGEKIKFAGIGNEPHNGILSDGIHGGTVFEGLYANFWIDTVNASFGTNITKFTDSELLIYSGIKKATISPTPAGKPGDADGDGDVDGVDYTRWLNNYNTLKTGPWYGDFNRDSKVDGVDYVIWLNNYNR